MEGKGQLKCFITILLVLGLVLEQSPVEAKAIWCCANAHQKYHFNRCVDLGIGSVEYCGTGTGCVVMDVCGGEWPVPSRKNLSLHSFHFVTIIVSLCDIIDGTPLI